MEYMELEHHREINAAETISLAAFSSHSKIDPDKCKDTLSDRLVALYDSLPYIKYNKRDNKEAQEGATEEDRKAFLKLIQAEYGEEYVKDWLKKQGVEDATGHTT